MWVKVLIGIGVGALEKEDIGGLGTTKSCMKKPHGGLLVHKPIKV